MNDKYKNKYRIPSARLSGWDYSQNGYYFITVCTANREKLFGEIIDTKMVLSETGIIVMEEWENSFKIRTELFCDVFVIMPNHIHAILRIEKPEYDVKRCRDARPCVSTMATTGDKQSYGVAYRSPKSISSFVAGFKSVATRKINVLRNTPGLPVWQTRFHDHIIRDIKTYHRIAHYINNNPALWQEDKYYK